MSWVILWFILRFVFRFVFVLSDELDEFLLHVVINGAVSGERTASFYMTRHGRDEVRVFHLLVEVADERLACDVARGYLAYRVHLLLTGERIDDRHFAVESGKSHHLADTLVEICHTIAREQCHRAFVLELVIDMQRTFGKRHTHGACIVVAYDVLADAPLYNGTEFGEYIVQRVLRTLYLRQVLAELAVEVGVFLGVLMLMVLR